MKLANFRISTILTFTMLLSVFVSVLIASLFWISDDFDTYHEKEQQYKDERNRELKKRLKNDMSQVLAYFNFTPLSSEEKLKNNLKDLIDSVLNKLNSISKTIKDKKVLEKTTIELLKSYSESDFFALRMNGEAILFPDIPDKEGEIILNFQDSFGNYVIREQINTIKTKKEGYSVVFFDKNISGEKIASKKLLFIKYFEPLDIIIGTGKYDFEIEEELKRNFYNWVKNFSHNYSGFIYIFNIDGKVILNSTHPEVENKIIWKSDSLLTKEIFLEKFSNIDDNGKLFEYKWYNPLRKAHQRKVSYAVQLKKYNWIIGIGTFADTNTIKITREKEKLKNKIIFKLKYILFILILLFVIFYFISRLFVKKINKSFNTLKNNLETLPDKETISLSEVCCHELKSVVQTINKASELQLKKIEELEYSKTLLNTILKEFPNGIIILLDKNFKFIIAEGQGFKGTDLTPEMHIGKHFSEVYDESVTSRVEKHIPLLVAGRQVTFDTEYGDKHYLLTLFPIKDDSGNLTNILGVTQNVTEKIHLEQQLKDREKKIREIIDITPIAVAMFQRDKRVTVANKRFVEMFAENMNIIGKTLKDISPTNFDKWSKAMDRCLKGEFVKKSVDVFIPTSGRTQWIKWSMYPSTKDGTVVSVMFFIQFITENIESSKNLKLEKDRLATILENMGEGVIVTDLANRITLANKASLSYINKSIEEVLGRNIDNFLISHKGINRQYENSNEKIYKLTNIDDITFSVYIQDIIDSTGESIGLLYIIRDVTEKYNLEKEIVKIKKLESISDLIQGVSHNFNNLFTTIIGNLMLVQSNISATPEIKEYLQEVENAAEQAKDLNLRLIGFSKNGIEQKQKIDIVNFVYSTISLVLSGSKIKLQKETYEDDYILCKVNEEEVKSIFVSLTTNAKNAMPDGGTLKVKFKKYTPKVSESNILTKDEYVKIDIEDTGVGIPKNKLEKIFDKKEHSSTDLSRTKEYLQNNDGHISVNSEVGKGSCFSVYLPLEKKDEIYNSKIKNENKTIIIMDDDASVLRVSSKILTKLGYRTIEVTDGYQLISIYENMLSKEQNVSIVLLDLTVPGKFGSIEIAKKLKQMDKNIKIIITSGYIDNDVLINYSKFGFDGSVSKPYRISELKTELNRVLQI